MVIIEACLYKKLGGGEVKCFACAHKCMIGEGFKGKCRVRKNVAGRLVLEVFGAAASFGIDLIEKKPLYHFLPNSRTFSFGTLGCNFRCNFCQNHDVSMPKNFIFEKNLMPIEAVNLAIANNCDSIAYTYNEPAIFAEYVLETARLARKAGLKNVLVTNGFLSLEVLELFSGVIDAVNIDLKSFSDDFYVKECGGRIGPVLDAIRFFHEKGVWVEITTLLIEGLNNSDLELKNIAKFIVSIDKNIPWHISRFFPVYKSKCKTMTSVDSLLNAKNIGLNEGLNFVYLGNVNYLNKTICCRCGAVLIERFGSKNVINIKNNKCSCGYILKGVFK